MLKRFVVAAVCLSWVAFAQPAAAQQQATLVLKSGNRISGQLVDLGGVGFTIRVNGAQRQIPTDQVAVVEFAPNGQLSADQQQKLQSGQQLVVLTNGEVIQGNLFDISGTTPLKLTVNTPSGQRDLKSNQVAQVYLAVPPGSSSAVATSGSQNEAVPAGAVTVPGNQQWTLTPYSVKKGQVVIFQTTGQIQYSPDASDTAGSAGSLRQQTAQTTPLPVNFVGALIGRIGPNGQPFAIGNQPSVTMPATGQLYLGVNDGNVADNTGAFHVVVRPVGR